MQTVHQLKALPTESAEANASQKAARAESRFVEQLTRDWHRDHPRQSNDRRPFPQAVVRVIERTEQRDRAGLLVRPRYLSLRLSGLARDDGDRRRRLLAVGAPIHRGDAIYRPVAAGPEAAECVGDDSRGRDARRRGNGSRSARLTPPGQ